MSWWLAGFEDQQNERKLGVTLSIHGLLLGNIYIVLDCVDAKGGDWEQWGQWYFPERGLFRHKWHGDRCEGFGES